jgi:hypothetical protein
MHTDRNANATELQSPTLSNRERLGAIRYLFEKRKGWETVEVLVCHLDWLADLAEESIDARDGDAVIETPDPAKNPKLFQVPRDIAGTDWPCYAERSD